MTRKPNFPLSFLESPLTNVEFSNGSSTLNALIVAYIKAKTEVKALEEKASGEIKLLPEIDLRSLEGIDKNKIMNLRGIGGSSSKKNPPSSALHTLFLEGRDKKVSDHMNELGLVQMHALKLASEQSNLYPKFLFDQLFT